MILSLRVATLTSLLLAAIACSGSSKGAEEASGSPTDTSTDATPAETEESAEEKFARQSEDTVNKMCQRLVDCSLADAIAQQPPEEVAKLKEAIPAAVNECTQQYVGAGFSPRQVIGIRECLGEATECSVFGDCLEAAIAPPAEGESEGESESEG